MKMSRVLLGVTRMDRFEESEERQRDAQVECLRNTVRQQGCKGLDMNRGEILDRDSWT